MPTYTVEITTVGRKVFQVKEAKTEAQAKEIARVRHEENAPIDQVSESYVVTDIKVIQGRNDEDTNDDK